MTTILGILGWCVVGFLSRASAQFGLHRQAKAPRLHRAPSWGRSSFS